LYTDRAACWWRCHYDAAEIAALAHELMKADAQTRDDKFLAWQKDPLGGTLRASKRIPNADFQRDMVYGGGPDFKTAMSSLNALIHHLKKLPA
jgi:hypothetical protein